MKYYSEITKKFYDTPESLSEEEKQVEAEKTERESAKKDLVEKIEAVCNEIRNLNSEIMKLEAKKSDLLNKKYGLEKQLDNIRDYCDGKTGFVCLDFDNDRLSDWMKRWLGWNK